MYRLGRWVGRYGYAAVRVICIVALLTPLRHADPRPPLADRGAFPAPHPLLCMHTRLTDEVEDWKIARSLQLVRGMGASTIVDFFPWAYVQGNRSTLDWHHPDRIMGYAAENDLKVIARIGLVPDWARPAPREQETTLNYLDPAHFPDFAWFAAQFAARYRDTLTAIIVWNEPNLPFEWGGQSVSPAVYTDLLRQVYEQVNQSAPDVLVLGGALAPTIDPAAISDTDYLDGMLQANAGAYLDGWAVHTYGFTLPADDPPAPDRLNFRRYELLRARIATINPVKPVYITESSWNDHPRWVNAVTPGERVRNTLDAMRIASERWPEVKSLCWWYFRYPTLTRSYMDYFAFVTPEFRLKPIYSALQEYVHSSPIPDPS